VDRNRFKTIVFKIDNGNKSNFIELVYIELVIDLVYEVEGKCGYIEYLCADKNPSYSYYKLANKTMDWYCVYSIICII
jgi:hypothetical protein